MKTRRKSTVRAWPPPIGAARRSPPGGRAPWGGPAALILLAVLLASGSLAMNGTSHAFDSSAGSAPLVSANATGIGGRVEAHWVVDPGVPGDDLPARGRSLFDFLVNETRGGERVQVVPFPFAALLHQLEARMGRDSRTKATKAVLIPLGRSLQRNSAA